MAFPVASFTSVEYQRLVSFDLLTSEVNRFASAHGLTVDHSIAADPLFEPRVDPSGQIVVWYLGASNVGSNGSSIDADIELTQPLGGATTMPVEGQDLRDIQLTAAIGGAEEEDPGVHGGDAQAATMIQLAMRLLQALMRSPGAVTAATWNLLPLWAKTALIQGGIGIGSVVAFDALFGGDSDGGAALPAIIPGLTPTMHADVPGVHLGAHVIGSWNTNPSNPALGVTFYRLSNGWLAVQNKKGRWKTWKPKKPVVLYAGGTKNLKTLLRADAIITKEAKKLQSMLNRRAPKPRKAREPKVIAISGGALPIHHQ